MPRVMSMTSMEFTPMSAVGVADTAQDDLDVHYHHQHHFDHHHHHMTDHVDGWFERMAIAEPPIAPAHPSLPAPPLGVVATHIDTHHSLLWSASADARVFSYAYPEWHRRTLWRTEALVRGIVAQEHSLWLALENGALIAHDRGGRVLHALTPPLPAPLTALGVISPLELVAGGASHVTRVDVRRGQPNASLVLDERDSVGGGVVALRRGRAIVCALSNGRIALLDQRTWSVQHRIDAHSAAIADVDVKGDILATCGFVTRHGHVVAEKFVKLFDLRMNRALSPIACPLGAQLLRFHPRMYSTVISVQQDGVVRLLDTSVDAVTSLTMAPTFQVALTAMPTAIDVASSGEMLLIGDAAGVLHSVADRPNARLALHALKSPPSAVIAPMVLASDVGVREHVARSISRNLVRPSQLELPTPLPHARGLVSTTQLLIGTNPAIADSAPLALLSEQASTAIGSLGVWHARQAAAGERQRRSLLSDVSGSTKVRVGEPPRVLPTELLAQMKVHDFVGYIRNSGMKRHDVQGLVTPGAAQRKKSPLDEYRPPKSYRYLEIKHTKLGTLQFDFARYNESDDLCGLENMIPNAYTNAVVQLLFHSAPLRAHLLNHLCKTEFCLACELGFLFHMLEQRNVPVCQASNFLRALRQIPQVSALGLVEPPDAEIDQMTYPRLVQQFTRFLFEQLHKETTAHGRSICTALFGASTSTRSRCLACRGETTREASFFDYDIAYPDAAADTAAATTADAPSSSFADVLRTTFEKRVRTKTWCERCKQYQLTTQVKRIASLPNSLCLYSAVSPSIMDRFWRTPGDDDIDAFFTRKETPSKRSQGAQLAPAFLPPAFAIRLLPSGETEVRELRTFEQRELDDRGASSRTAVDGDDDMSSIAGVNVATRLDFDALTAPSESDAAAAVALIDKTAATLRSSVNTGDDADGDDDAAAALAPVPVAPPVAPAVVDAAVARRAQYLAELNDTADADGWSIYELTSTVSQVWDRDKAAARPCHLITHVRRADGWYLFNDFHVLPVPQRHALRFNHWKWPCVLQFDCLLPATDALFVAAEPRRATITGDVFFERSPYHQHNASVPRTFVPVTRRTMPGAGDVVALDAEFVSLGAEETEIREDGSRAIINPVHFALARVSLCRENGECFMDDYVATHEPVVDYLTRYSGIAPGDLEPNTSKKHLATHKHVYLKLRYLIDRGVVLLGHGLAKDFRIINIAPPADRVIDTVELFHLERQRKIALRFLASVLLGSDIQTHSHDSVEDALSALKLWKTCRALRDAGDGVFARTLNKIYQIGRTTEWKVENLDSSAQEILWSEIQLIKK
jgi:hypothetical protein